MKIINIFIFLGFRQKKVHNAIKVLKLSFQGIRLHKNEKKRFDIFLKRKKNDTYNYMCDVND